MVYKLHVVRQRALSPLSWPPFDSFTKEAQWSPLGGLYVHPFRKFTNVRHRCNDISKNVQFELSVANCMSVDSSFIMEKSLHKIRENFSSDEINCSWFISAFFPFLSYKFKTLLCQYIKKLNLWS